MAPLSGSRSLAPLVAFAVLLGGGCGADPAPASSVSGYSFDINGGDVGELGDLAAVDGGADAGAVDAASDAADTPSGPDGTAASCPGGPGCACTAHTQCDTGICLDHPNGASPSGKECAATCSGSCTKGFNCSLTSVGGDPVSICVPTAPNLCNPCAASKECEAIGYNNAACVDQGGLGAFCGVACAADGDCPADYDCKDVKSVEGATSKQCVAKPAAGSADAFGTCSCTASAVKKKLATSCKVAALDDKGQPIGSCTGQRSCGDKGLSACQAPAVGKEVCDGVDNDCNGKVDDGACDDGKPCTVDACDPLTKQCKSTAGADGLSCDADGSACTSGDKCVAGTCVAGGPLDCDDKNPCTEDSCNPKEGCVKKPLDAVACEDGNACTIGDTCKSGSCASGSPKVCESGDPCVTAKCSIKDGGNCVFADAIEGLPCDDGNACTEQDACKGGSCTPGGLAVCDDNNSCTTDSCDGKKGCVQTNNNKPCDADGNLCTVGDACVGGTCTAGKASGCDDSNPCTVDSCDAKTGKCAYDGAKAAGVPCNDDDVCTQSDACNAGVCQGSKKNCDDGNACTADSCDAKQGCASASISAACNDGNACTENDACAGNLCKGAAKLCDDGDPCTADSCDPKTGCKVSAQADKYLCGVGKWCMAGKCVASCADDCAAVGATSCEGDAVISCGQSDADVCLDWSAPKPCSLQETCKAGACVQKDAPHNIVINEVLYDGAGVDADAFVELFGPAGADLTGWSLVGVDGNGGKAYNAIDLKGKIPADGHFVVAATTAQKTILDVADLVSAQADFQNGPDSLELRYGAKVVDAVGYGIFTGAVFKGEGLPAPDAENGASIGRDAQSTDSNDNSKDFKIFLKPTPGAEDLVPNELPVVALKCPATVSVGAKIKLDTTGTGDADGQIVACAAYLDGKLVAKAGSCAGLEVTLDSAGKHTAQVVATDDKGGEGAQSCVIDVSASNKPPIVALSCPAAVEVGKAAAFNASASSDPDGTIAGFTWSFGDGSAPSAGSAATVNHTFAAAGAYEVSVEVKDDKGAVSKGSCLVQAKAANQLPAAKLVCPASLVIGATGSFDASGSTDADGSIKSYTFVFSDGSAPVQGSASKVARAFAKAGTVTVNLTVVDDVGGEGKADCTFTVSSSNPPDVVIVKPTADLNVTQGEAVSFIVDATSKAGKAITKVTLYADGQPIGTDTTAPYTFTYSIDALAKTGAKIAVVAAATDDAGAVGSSTPRTLTVVNQPPKAAFSAVVSGALEVAVDGSLSADTETPTADLEVRWDWESDGTWDLDWSKTKVLKHTYAKSGSYTITMEVRDAVGQVNSTTRKVDLSLLQTVFGTVNTTTWVGTVIVTGNVVVPAGQVLTIAPGTSVQFAVVDQDKNGKGDYSLTVNGKIDVQGSETQPVVFTNYGTAAVPGKGWDKIVIAGDGSSFAHVIVEFADVGIEAKKKVTLTNAVLRKNRVGLVVGPGGQPEGKDSQLIDNVENGAQVGASGALLWSGGAISKNGKSGVLASSASASASLQLDGTKVEGNGYVGLEIWGGVGGLVTKTTITGNAFEGVRLSPVGTLDPGLALRINNIYANATKGARAIKATSIVASASGSGTATSPTYNVPGGATAELIGWSYSEVDYNTYCSGTVHQGSSAGPALVSASTTSSGITDVRGSGTTSIVTSTYKGTSSSSYSAVMHLSMVAYDELGAKRELTAVRNAGETDARWNWFGAFPAVLPLVAYNQHQRLNIQGFVGEKFGADWSRGSYYGGETAPADLSWQGTVYLSGSLTIAAGKKLTIEPGTTVQVVNHDQTGDGAGDWQLVVAGALSVKGSAASPVLFTSPGGLGKPNLWQKLVVSGGASSASIAHTTFESTANGVELGSGSHVLSNVVLQKSAGDGLTVSGATSVSLAAVKIRDNAGRGVLVTSSAGFTIDGAAIHDNGSHGIEVVSSSNAITIGHASITKNKAAGVKLDHATATISQCDLTYNAIGAHVRGQCGGKILTSNIKYNNHEGVAIFSHGTAIPTLAIGQSNLFGNGIVSAGAVHTLNASVGASGVGTYTSPLWKSADGSPILAYQYSYNEVDYNTYCSGQLLRDSASGPQLHSHAISVAAYWYDITFDPATALVGSVYKGTSSSSYSASVSLPRLYFRKKDAGTEVSVLTSSGTLDMKGNYWGDGSFPNAVPKVALARSDAADLQGPQPLQISGTGPQK